MSAISPLVAPGHMGLVPPAHSSWAGAGKQPPEHPRQQPVQRVLLLRKLLMERAGKEELGGC